MEDRNDSISTKNSSFCSVTIVNIAQKLIAEIFGMFVIIVIGCGSVVVNKMYGAVTFLGICITWGLVVMVMVYSLGHISGAHFNPAVTLTFAALGRFPLKQVPLYILSQLVGATLGSWVLFLLLSPGPEHFYGTTPIASDRQSLFLEIIISFLLMFVISAVSTDARAIRELAGIVVGSAVVMLSVLAGLISGASMNPARSIGPAIVMHNYKSLWIYIFAPVIGMLAGGFTYNFFGTMMASRSDRIEEDTISKMEEGGGSSVGIEGSRVCSPTVVACIQRLIAEAVGTFFIIFIGCGSIVGNKIYTTVTFPGICIAWGLVVMAMIYTVGHISGAHFNPAVTITFTALRTFPVKEAPLYIVAQLVGATFGSGVLYLLLKPKPEQFYGTTPVGSDIQSFVLEIIISFLLMFVISGASADTRAIGELGGLAVGATILIACLAAGPISGASMNPARSIGPAIVMHNYKALWAYIFGPVIGMLAGGFTYKLIKFTDKPSQNVTKNSPFLKNINSSNDD
ncbi:probable aquaporin NIP-type [Ananas comosus]|uniref:Probable aquaporin NIP-type n=1 Tax=Ananas comosus TaxID=4615 RepID=A0A6P5EZY6_ANACO|nr:probable aquaporin NIP-type [Ananas comosus]